MCPVRKAYKAKPGLKGRRARPVLRDRRAFRAYRAHKVSPEAC